MDYQTNMVRHSKAIAVTAQEMVSNRKYSHSHASDELSTHGSNSGVVYRSLLVVEPERHAWSELYVFPPLSGWFDRR